VPRAVHRGDGDGRERPRKGRGWLIVLAAVVLPAAAYFATVQLLSEDQRGGIAADVTVVETAPPTTARPRCPGGFTEPVPRTPTRSAPLNAIRAHTGWSDEFLVDEMRAWRTSAGQRRWYVKASQLGDRSRNGRWLVGQDQGGRPRVLASAPFDTRGYVAGDWDVADGQKAPTGVAGCLAGT